jgi:hypothetical protein
MSTTDLTRISKTKISAKYWAYSSERLGVCIARLVEYIHDHFS